MPGVFHAAIEAIVQREDGLILLTQRPLDKDHAPGEWETLTGRVEQGETFEEAAKREVREETGLDAEIVHPLCTFHFYRGREKVEHLGVSFLCRSLGGKVVLDGQEQVDFRWVSPMEALRMITTEEAKEGVRSLIRRLSA